ncbi:MAG: hypothetical protein U9R75_00035 [Candidatus Thermoplasmatota archaeon]|nr:hypothetical protein [Candidatus Thermoplasmatota archaeon]
MGLFQGKISGYTTNPVTGKLLSRADLMKIYRYLCQRIVQKGPGEVTYDLLRISRKLLEIPEDVHQQILKEIASAPAVPVSHGARPYLLEELEAIRENLSKVDGSKDSIVDGRTMVDEMDSDILELEKGSLVEQMERIECVGSMGQSTSFSTDFSLGDLGQRVKKDRSGNEGP